MVSRFTQGFKRTAGSSPSWWHSQDSKPTYFDVQGSTKLGEHHLPERAAICLNYETAAISVSGNLAANYVGMDVDLSITRTEAGDSPTKPSDVVIVGILLAMGRSQPVLERR